MEMGENNPYNMLIERLTGAAYDWHAYGKDTIGARSDVEGVDIARLQAFYRRTINRTMPCSSSPASSTRTKRSAGS
jgi:predicted Zn-dependent peptidase